VDLVARFDVYLVALDPTRGSEIQKTRPCVIVSPNEMNAWLRTVIVAPMTNDDTELSQPCESDFARKKGQVALDQIRAIDKSRLGRRLGRLDDATGIEIATILTEIFAIS
jgi:mRNA interferase MazF